MRDAVVHHFAGGSVDRAAERRSDGDWLLQQARGGDAIAVPVHGSRLWVERDPPRALLLPAHELLVHDEDLRRWTFLGLHDARATFAFDSRTVKGDRSLAGELASLRQVAAILAPAEGALLAYASALLHWQRSSRYCGRCGGETTPLQAGHVLRCANCEREHYPRTSPAVIVLVHDGAERCLLGRQATWPFGVYSTLAGFVEPGESLDDAVRREVLEESGVTVGSIRYDSSQPWPFPDSLMLGFHAVAESTELHVAEDELEDARWFTRTEVLDREGPPRLPPRFSIARHLIDGWARRGIDNT